MGWLRRKKTYDRGRLLNAATRARKKGKRQKAIALYREILAVEPDNPDLHRRIAPLLAETKQRAAAWESYRRATDGLVRQGFVEKAVGVLREASVQLPREPEVWMALADFELKRRRQTAPRRGDDAAGGLGGGSEAFLEPAIKLVLERQDRPGLRATSPVHFTG